MARTKKKTVPIDEQSSDESDVAAQTTRTGKRKPSDSNNSQPDPQSIQAMATDERNFYTALKRDKELFTKKAMSKYPLKEKISDIIEMLNEEEPSTPHCPAYHELRRKWTVDESGKKLLNATNKREITAYEDIFQFIYNIDQQSGFKSSNIKLSIHVSDVTGNITATLVKLYCQFSSTREGKKRPKRSLSSPAESKSSLAKKDGNRRKKQEEIKQATIKIKNFYASSIIRSTTQCASPNEEDEEASIRQPTGNRVTSAKSTSNQNDDDSTESEDDIPRKPAHQRQTEVLESSESDEFENNVKEQSKQIQQSAISSSKKTVAKDSKLNSLYTKVSELDSMEGGSKDVNYLSAKWGLFNDDDNDKVCWMNCLCIILFHQLSDNVITASRGFKVETVDQFSSEKKKFTANAYEIISHLQRQTINERNIGAGNLASLPFVGALVKIFLNHVNSTLSEETKLQENTYHDIIDLLTQHDLISWFDNLDPLKVHFSYAVYDTVYLIENKNKEFTPPSSHVLAPKCCGMFELPATNTHWCSKYNKDTEKYVNRLRKTHNKNAKSSTERLKKDDKLPEDLLDQVHEYQKNWVHAIEPKELVSQCINFCETVDPSTQSFDELKSSPSKKFLDIHEFPEVITITLSVTSTSMPLYGIDIDSSENNSATTAQNNNSAEKHQTSNKETTATVDQSSAVVEPQGEVDTTSVDKPANADNSARVEDSASDNYLPGGKDKVGKHQPPDSDNMAGGKDETGRKKKKSTAGNGEWLPPTQILHHIKNIGQLVTISKRPIGEDIEKAKYQTCGLIMHKPSDDDYDKGHYVCFVKTRGKFKKDQEWFYFDDLSREYIGGDKFIKFEIGTLVAVMMRRVHNNK